MRAAWTKYIGWAVCPALCAAIWTGAASGDALAQQSADEEESRQEDEQQDAEELASEESGETAQRDDESSEEMQQRATESRRERRFFRDMLDDDMLDDGEVDDEAFDTEEEFGDASEKESDSDWAEDLRDRSSMRSQGRGLRRDARDYRDEARRESRETRREGREPVRDEREEFRDEQRREREEYRQDARSDRYGARQYNRSSREDARDFRQEARELRTESRGGASLGARDRESRSEGQLAKALRVRESSMRVWDVEPDSWADEAGLRPGDRIVSIDGQRVRSMEDVDWLLRESMTGPVRIAVIRDGEERVLSASLTGDYLGPDRRVAYDRQYMEGEFDDTATMERRENRRELRQRPSSERPRWLGISMRETGRRGVLITRVAEGSPADEAGLRPRDLIVTINGEPIHDPEDVTWLVANSGDEADLEIDVRRNGRDRYLVASLGSYSPYDRYSRPMPDDDPYRRNDRLFSGRYGSEVGADADYDAIEEDLDLDEIDEPGSPRALRERIRRGVFRGLPPY